MSVDRDEAHRCLDALLGATDRGALFAALTTFAESISPHISRYFEAEWAAVAKDEPDDERAADLDCVARLLLTFQSLLPSGRDIARQAACEILIALPAGDEPNLFRGAKRRRGRQSALHSTMTKMARDRIATAICVEAAFAGVSRTKAGERLRFDQHATPATLRAWVRAIGPERARVAQQAGFKTANGMPLTAEETDARDGHSLLGSYELERPFRLAAGTDPNEERR